MPHKHTRRGSVDKATIDLPPTIIAKPLPVSKSANANGIFTSSLDNTKRTSKKRKRNNKDTDDDTPKAFQRLMAMAQGKKLPKGLDDGRQLSKKQKKAATASATQNNNDDSPTEEKPGNDGTTRYVPKIRPGERMSDFAARVDAALPLSNLINKTARGGKDPLGLRVSRTKTEKRMHRMYAEWRAEEARRQEKRLEAAELAEEEEQAVDEDGQVKWKVDIEAAKAASASTANAGKKKGSKNKKKKRKVLGEIDDGEDDPWARIGRDRGEEGAGGRIAFNDVVQAPPSFTTVPKQRFKEVAVGDVPRKSGSLRRREELSEVRRSVVEGYRAMMKAGKEDAAG